MANGIDLEQALRLAQGIQSNSLEEALGGALVGGLGAAQAGSQARARKKRLLEIARSLGLPEGAETFEDLARLAQAKAAVQRPIPASESEKAANRERLEILKARLRPQPGQAGTLKGAEFNRLIGEELFPPEADVSVRQQITATKGLEIQRAGTPAAEQLANIQSGRDALDRIDAVLSGPGATTKKLLASTEFTSGFSEEAQKLRDDALEAIDVLTRARTGAALNENEQRLYQTRLLGLFRRPATIRFTIANLRKLYDTNEALLRSGRRLPGKEQKADVLREINAAIRGDSGAPAPSQGPISQPTGSAAFGFTPEQIRAERERRRRGGNARP